jgi:Asp-tRNA(Asn)/Glu-tRNA(Gln) amidotransferase A subunit family amidase
MTEEKDIVWMSALELASAIKKGKLSPVEVLEIFLKRIKALNPKINAFVTLTEESARTEAKECEKAVKVRKKLGPLHGIPVAIKDNIPTKGVRTTWGSKLFENYIPNEDMILVDRLRRAGAVIIGKTNMPEFGLLGITDNPLFGATKNPWDTNRTPGGSSGGSAAAVAAGMVPIAVGNDGGGSIRIPSSFCGVYGIKPHLGRIPRYPTPPGWETLSSEGPIARTVSDAAMMLDVMAGPDERDYLSLPAQDVNYLEGLKGNVKKKMFAYSADLGYKVVDQEVAELIKKAVTTFKELGFQVEEVKLDFIDIEMDWVNMIISETVATFEDRMEELKKVCYPPYLDFLALADYLKSVDYVKALYKRKELWDQVRRVFEKYDFLLTPTTAIPAFGTDIGMGPQEIAGNPIGPTGWFFTIPFNLTQQPAASVPCGFTKNNLPVGLQIVGKRYDELGVLKASRAFEKGLPWRHKRPEI